MFFDEILGQFYVRYKCNQDGGAHILEKVVLGEGYLDADSFQGCDYKCISALTKLSFKFYEQNVREPVYNTKKYGIHHFYLADEDSGRCAKDPKDLTRYSIWYETGVPAGKCVAYTLLNKPESRYEVSKGNMSFTWLFSEDRPPTFLPNTKLDKDFAYIKDLKNGRLVASYTHYRWWGGWVRRYSFSHNSASVCATDSDKGGDFWSILEYSEPSQTTLPQ
ncbi:MAG: hypothetical protein Q8K52_11010 [Thiobacillus sp.]|nr:hypothetical protein [Thiobacillus sp.]